VRGTPFVSQLVFHRDGKEVGDFRRAWKRAALAAGVPERRYHDLRRSYARLADRAGVSRHVAMATGGWKTEGTYQRYNIVAESDLQAGAKQVQMYLDTLPVKRNAGA